MLDDSAYILIKKGDPDQLHKRKFLSKDAYTIGRRGTQFQPDIAFSSLYVSRKHALLQKMGELYAITDLQSKHGTQVNGVDVYDTPQLLRHGDHISLAKGAVELIFFAEGSELDATRELSLPMMQAASELPGLLINLERREIRLDGKRLHLTGKDMDLLMLLYQRANQAVSYEEIMVLIWPERLAGSDKTIPDVGKAEINALVYRLRKRLGRYGENVTTIPRYGYMWEMEEGG
ncbi:FHA domain-containing protein [Brevibacillus centrosporus]|uniref:Transcriptional regulatory protein, C terminal n=1 Tax=Brevibacillus centrosporus TaxID=54910 RepID=A0A1I3ZFP3_9BACL|nr:FHA domain-containing protein [Brevibacillus centrosporus]MED1954200.1 FHA domain-containing protein [Brevibacillus centrosporus]MED4911550.1 FHA domain-containing protein [Brevibacillus centrosporus]SFK42389.1 Transcriptional regulatory protein, C terminal [Brevibacillus centrosporus]